MKIYIASSFRNKLSIGETGLAVNWMDYPTAVPSFVRRLRHLWPCPQSLPEVVSG